jgi:hypothetical protein
MNAASHLGGVRRPDAHYSSHRAPLNRNAGVSDQPVPEKAAIDCRASLEFLLRTSAWLARNVTLAGRRRLISIC